MSNQSIKTIRLSSDYFRFRKKKMHFQGRIERIKKGRYLVTSEETPFMILPLMKYAKEKKSTLFFIERGAYPQKKACDILNKCLDTKIPLYSYKILKREGNSKSISGGLADTIVKYIQENFPNVVYQKITEEDIKKINKLWKEVRKQDKQKIKKRFPEISQNFNSYIGKNKLEFLFKLIKSEHSNLLDTIKECLSKNRANMPGSLHYKAKYEKSPVIFYEKDFCSKKSNYRKEISNYLKSKFPDGIDGKSERAFFHEFNNFNRGYMKKHFKEISFITLPLVKLITKSMGVRLNNVIYCVEFPTLTYKYLLKPI